MNFDNVHSITFKTLGGKSEATYTALFGGSVDDFVKISDDFSDNSVLWRKKEVVDNFLEYNPSWVIKGITFKQPTLCTTDEKESKLEPTLNITQDIYFDVAKHAKAWGVEHEEASEIIQKEVLSNGIYWCDGDDTVCNKSAEILFVRNKRGGCEMSFGQSYYEKKGAKEAALQASTTYTLLIEEKATPEPQEELVELLGKKYSKADIEKALLLLKPKEEV